MKSKILSLLGVGAIAFAVACNSSSDETKNADSSATGSNESSVSGSTGSASVQTTADGKRYVLRARTGSSSTSGTSSASSGGSEYDTVWLYMGTQDRYYTLGGSTGRDTLYFDTDDWKTWWNNPETDNELKMKSGSTKVKVDDDGSWKVKDSASKTKMDESGKVKTKPRKD